MAQRRMFSPQIVGSDAFLEMPVSSRELYFQLGMYADDDGFISPKKVMRMVGAGEDDLKMLFARRFALPFENGVVVIKHWMINNLIRKDFYRPTQYTEQKQLLLVKENKAYTLDETQGVPLLDSRKQIVNNPLPQDRIGKDRIGKKASSAPRTKKTPKYHPLSGEVLKAFEIVDPKVKTMYANTTQRKAASFLIEEYGIERVLKAIAMLPAINEQNLYIAQITTPYELQQNWIKLGNAVRKKANLQKENLSKVIW